MCKYLHSPEFCINSRLYLESITEEYIALLCEDREDELIIVFETIGEVFERHDSVFYFFSEECLLKEIVELYLVELSDDEYVDDIVRSLITEVEDPLRDSHEVKCLAPLEELFDRSHNIICLEIHLTQFVVYRAIVIHLIILLLVLLV